LHRGHQELVLAAAKFLTLAKQIHSIHDTITSCMQPFSEPYHFWLPGMGEVRLKR
jgi:hypothetical protein